MRLLSKSIAVFLVAALASYPIWSYVLSAGAQTPVTPVSGITTISASSGNVAAAVATATIAANGRQAYICGFVVKSLGATGASVVNVTVTGLAGGTQTYTYNNLAGVAVSNETLNVNFNGCLAATGPNVAIAVSLPSLGTGNTNATVNAWGYYN